MNEVTVQFAGYTVDLFETESGNLGITVYPAERVEENTKSVDIAVSKELEVHSSEWAETNGGRFFSFFSRRA
jgi:hypothetical protein